jgi:iron complex outermembrane receptor protein
MRLLPATTLAIFISGLFNNPASAQIEELVVTAQKRPENIQDVPISISAYSGNFLEKSGIKTLQDLGAYTPNLTLSQSSQVANQRIIMRGVGSVGDSAIEPSVAVFIDGIYYPRSASVTGTLSDLELVEVLRGPQGTLFGRNASMGALNITTRKPADELEGVLRTSYGNYNDFRVAGSISNALTENTGGRLSFHYSDRAGYGNNTFTGAGNEDEFGDWEDSSVRGKLSFNPSEVLDINLTLDYASVKNQSGVIEVLSNAVLPAYLGTLSVVLNPLGPLAGGPLPATTDTFDYTVNQDHRDYGDDEQWGGAADISWKLGNHTVRSLTGYRSWENDTFESALRLPADLLNRLTNYQTETFSQEIQLLSDEGDFLEYVAGLYYYNERYDIDQLFNLGPDFCPAVRNLVAARSGSLTFGTAANAQCAAGPQTGAVDLDFEQELKSLAAYGQVTFHIDEQLHVSGGLRWTRDNKDGSFDQLVPNTILLPPTATNPLAINLRAIDSAPALEFNDKELTWMVNISYDVTDSVMGYATVSTGFKSGGFNSDGANRVIPRTFESETVDNYELGLKSSLFENRLVANVGIFRTSIDSFQDRQFDGVNFIVQNVGELIQDGIELDLLAQPNDNLYLAAGLSLLDSEFKSFPNATNLPAIVAAAQRAGTIPATQDLTGERNHFSPEWQVSLVSEWRDNFGDNGLGWFVRGEYQYVDEQNVGAETNQNPQSIQPSYDLVNIRAGLTGTTENWEVSVFGKNITDEGYCQTIFNQPIGTTLGLVDATTGGGMQRCVLGTPKTYGVEASYRF